MPAGITAVRPFRLASLSLLVAGLGAIAQPPSAPKEGPLTWEKVVETANKIADRLIAEEPAKTEAVLTEWNRLPTNESRVEAGAIRKRWLAKGGPEGVAGGEQFALLRRAGLKDYATATAVARGRKRDDLTTALKGRFDEMQRKGPPVTVEDEAAELVYGWTVGGEHPAPYKSLVSALNAYYSGKKLPALEALPETDAAFGKIIGQGRSITKKKSPGL